MCGSCWMTGTRYGLTSVLLFFFFNDTATTEIYTLSLHDALPISASAGASGNGRGAGVGDCRGVGETRRPRSRLHRDRKSTRLNSSHGYISYAVFCLKKKTTRQPRA